MQPALQAPPGSPALPRSTSGSDARSVALHMIARAAFALAVAGVAALALSSCRGWDSEHPPVHLNWNMDTQEKGKAFRRNDMFEDKRSMRMPVEGTVARGYLNEDDELHTGVGADGQPLDAKTLPKAIKSDAEFVARGANRYQIYCAPCHGRDHDGKGPVGQPGRLLVAPPSFLDARLIGMPTGQIYKAIHVGVNNDNMPSYANQIPVTDRWAIVAHLCMKQGGKDPTKPCDNRKVRTVVDYSKNPTVVSAERGEQVYATNGACNACHTDDGTPKIGPTFKGLYGKSEQTSAGAVTVDDAYIAESIANPSAKVVNGFPPVMPARPDLSEAEVKSLIEFIKTLK